MPSSIIRFWGRLSGPLKTGIGFALVFMGLAIIGIFRDPGTPVTGGSLLVGGLISGGVWGLISWAIATAVVTVESDLAAVEHEPE